MDINDPGGSNKRKLLRGTITLLAGAGIGRILGILSIPLLTRIYSPEDFGILAAFNAVVLIAVPFMTLRYVIAIPLAKTERMAAQLLGLCTLTIGFISLGWTLLLMATSESLFQSVNMPSLANYWGLIVIGAAGAATYETALMLATRKRDYKLIARTQILQSAIGESAKLLLGLIAIKPAGLLIGQVMTQSCGAGIISRKYFSHWRILMASVDLKRIWLTAKLYRDIPFYRLPSQILLVGAAQAPILFVSTFYGEETTGHLGLALMALALPVSLIANSAGQALYGEASALGKKRAAMIFVLSKDTTFKLAAAALLPACILYFFGAELFTLAFGSQWRTAGEYASILSIYLVFQFASGPITKVLNVIGAQRLFLAFNFQRLGLILGIFVFARIFETTISTTLLSYSLILSAHYAYVTCMILYKIKTFR